MQLFRGSDQGASAVETAFVLPILIVIVVGIIEFGLLFNRLQGMHAASRESARLASLVGVDLDAIQTRSEAAAPPFVDFDDLEVIVTRVPIEEDGDEGTTTSWTWNPATDTWSGGATGAEIPCDAAIEPSPSSPPAANEIVSVNVRVELELLNPANYGYSIPLFGSIAFGHPSTGEFRCEF